MVVVALPSLRASAQQATFLAEQDTIRIGEQVRLSLELTMEPGISSDSLYWPSFGDSLGTGIEKIRESGIDTITAEYATSGLIVLRQYITVTGWEAGTKKIAPASFLLRSDTIYSNAPSLTIVSTEVDLEKDFKDIKDIYDLPAAWVSWLAKNWYYLLAGAVALGALVYFLLRKRPAPIPVAADAPKIPANEAALMALNVLEGKQLWQHGAVKQYYTELTDILRLYIEARFGIPAREEITAQILKDLRRVQVDPGSIELIRKTLQIADMTKFARRQPTPEESAECMTYAVQFVKQTSAKEEMPDA